MSQSFLIKNKSHSEIVFVSVKSPAALMHLNYIVTVSIFSLIRVCDGNFQSQSSKMTTRWLLLQRGQKKHNVIVLKQRKDQIKWPKNECLESILVIFTYRWFYLYQTGQLYNHRKELLMCFYERRTNHTLVSVTAGQGLDLIRGAPINHSP